jgi:branched-chain amino acid transport system substrate-binding protein
MGGKMRSIFIAALALSALLSVAGEAAAQDDAKIALIAPLSGPYGRQGQLMRYGAEQAIEEINRGGGIKALNGAKLTLVVADAGDSIEKARNAAQRLVAQEPDIVAGTGAWLSSFSLAVTEVTERAEIPWLTLSYSDQITSRGYKYVFQMSPSAGKQAQEAIPTIMTLAQEQTGKSPTTVGIIQDNTALAMSFVKQMRASGLQAASLKLTVDETFTPPLNDATSLIQRLRAARPDFLVMLPSNVPDTKLLIEKVAEFGLGNGRMPTISSGGQTGAPELLNVVGKDNLEGFMGIVANWPMKGTEEIVATFKKNSKEPWMTQDTIMTYVDVYVMKAALEAAASANPKKVADAMRALDLKDGVATLTPGGRIRFDETGRLIDAPLVVIQWQNGVPEVIYPSSIATAKAVWPKR